MPSYDNVRVSRPVPQHIAAEGSVLHGETRTGLSRHFEGNRSHSVFPSNRQTDPDVNST